MLFKRILLIFVVSVVMWFLWQGLGVENHRFTANKPLAFPTFALTDIRQPEKKLTLEDLKGKVSIVHFWATWCSVCIKEHAEWLKIARQWHYPLIGVVYRDDSQQVRQLLEEKGDPYTYLLDDKAGSLGLGLGLVGTPQTFLVDTKGSIQFQYLGPLTQQSFEKLFLPRLQALEKEGSQSA